MNRERPTRPKDRSPTHAPRLAAMQTLADGMRSIPGIARFSGGRSAFSVGMRRWRWVVVALLAASPIAAQRTQPGRLVIIGGGLSSSNEAVYRSILDGRFGSGPLCVFPTAGATPDSAMAGPVATFDRYGGPGTAKGVLVDMNRPETARDPAVVSQIAKCSGFFFIGGVQSRVIAAFRPNGVATPAYEALMARWREGAVVAGSSAGAAVMSDPMIAGGTSAGAMRSGIRRVASSPNDTTESGGVALSPGLGFFPAALADQHFLARGRFGRLLVAITSLDEFDLAFGIDENTALVVDGTMATVAGASGVVVMDERGATRAGTSVSGVRLHLVSAGDRFDLSTRAPQLDPAKTARRPLPADSAQGQAPGDIFARWEFLRQLDRFSRSSASSATFAGEGATVTLRKDPGFRSVSRSAAGIQGAPDGFSLTGLLLDLKR